MLILEGAGEYTAPGPGEGSSWAEHFRASDLSVGTYSLPRGGTDEQEPHTEDEIYVVTRGHALLVAGDHVAKVGPGTVAYVPAAEVHRFTDLTEDFAALVLFAPAEYSRGPAPE